MPEEFEYTPQAKVNPFPEMEEITVSRERSGIFKATHKDQLRFKLIVWQSGYEIITTETFSVKNDFWGPQLSKEIVSPTRRIILHFITNKGGIKSIEFEQGIYFVKPHSKGVQLLEQWNNKPLAVAIASWRDSEIQRGIMGHVYSNPSAPIELVAYIFIHILLIENFSGFQSLPFSKPI